jgi:hypothetical protein
VAALRAKRAKTIAFPGDRLAADGAKKRFGHILVPNDANNSPVRYRVPLSSDQRFLRM